MLKKTLLSHSLQAKVIACHGRDYRIQTENHSIFNAFVRGKKNNLACGDEVICQAISPQQAVIERILPRKNLVFRSDSQRQKLIAANCSQLLIVVAPQPLFSDDFLTRALIIAHVEKLKPLILLNKYDLIKPEMQQRLSFYQRLNYPILPLCALHNVDTLRQHLENETSLLLGQSGVGKSSILNALFHKNLRKTAPISKALQKGKHTSTHSELYFYSPQAAIIDSPGLQQLGLAHFNQAQIESAFIEFQPFLGQCRFRNCLHQNEPECAILHALQSQAISPFRYTIFQNLMRAIPR